MGFSPAGGPNPLYTPAPGHTGLVKTIYVFNGSGVLQTIGFYVHRPVAGLTMTFASFELEPNVLTSHDVWQPIEDTDQLQVAGSQAGMQLLINGAELPNVSGL
jgi:hypothetical protein